MESRQTSSDERTIDVGLMIRLLRERKDLSQKEVAAQSGLSRNTLSLIERGKTSPTVSTLKRIASALHVDINAFFEATDKTSIVHTKSELRPSILLSECLLADLGAGLLEQFVTPLHIRLDPGARSGNSVSHEGQDFIFCLKGEVIFYVNDHAYVLGPGDSLLYDGQLDHSFKNAGLDEAELLIVLSTPQDGFHYINSHALTNHDSQT